MFLIDPMYKKDLKLKIHATQGAGNKLVHTPKGNVSKSKGIH